MCEVGLTQEWQNNFTGDSNSLLTHLVYYASIQIYFIAHWCYVVPTFVQVTVFVILNCQLATGKGAQSPLGYTRSLRRCCDTVGHHTRASHQPVLMSLVYSCQRSTDKFRKLHYHLQWLTRDVSWSPDFSVTANKWKREEGRNHWVTMYIELEENSEKRHWWPVMDGTP